MIKKITITNFQGESMDYLIDGVQQDNPSGLIITKIDGLGPVKADINMSNLVTSDGGLFNSARLNNRNIVITALFTHPTSIEDARLKSYKYFPIKKKLTFRIETDNRTAETTGYVESNEPFIFEEETYCQISILCEDSHFVDVSDLGREIISVSNTIKLFEFPFESGSGQHETFQTDLSMDLIKQWNNPGRVAKYVETIVYQTTGGVMSGTRPGTWKEVYADGWINTRYKQVTGTSYFDIDETSAIDSSTTELSNKSYKSLTVTTTNGSNGGSRTLIQYGTQTSIANNLRLVFQVTDLSGAALTNAKVKIINVSSGDVVVTRNITTTGKYDISFSTAGYYYLEFYATGDTSSTGSIAIDMLYIRTDDKTYENDNWVYCFNQQTNAQIDFYFGSGSTATFGFDSLYGSDNRYTTKDLEFIVAKFVAPSNELYLSANSGDWFLSGTTFEIRDDITREVVNVRSTSEAQDLYLNHLTPGKTYNITLCMPSGQYVNRPAGSLGVTIPQASLYTLTDGDIELGDLSKQRLSNVVYTGDLDTGFTIILTADSTVRDITIYNAVNGDTMSIDTSKIRPVTGGSYSHMLSGDEIRICTINGKKSATLTRGGKRYNILNTLNKDCSWFQLTPGVNKFAYDVADGQDHLYMKFIVDRTFEGV